MASLRSTGSWRSKEIACWRVFRTAPIMCNLADPAVLDRYAAAFRTRLERSLDSWPFCPLAGARCRSEPWEAEHRRQVLFHGSSLELSAYVPERPQNSVIRESSNGWDFWKEQRSWTSGRSGHWYRRRQGEVGARKRSGAGRDPQRVQRRSSEVVLEANIHCEEVGALSHPLQLESRYASNLIGTLADAQRSEHTCVVCEFCLEPHRTVECPDNPGWRPPKGSGRVRGECCVHPAPPPALKRLNPSQLVVVLRGRSPLGGLARDRCPSLDGGAKSGERHFLGSGRSQDLVIAGGASPWVGAPAVRRGRCDTGRTV